MARGKKTNAKIKAKVIAEKIKSPDMSSRDIASKLKEEGEKVSNDTVCDILNDKLPQVATESQRIASIIENDLESVQNMSEIVKKYTQQLKAKEKIDRADIAVANTTTESAFKRSQLLQGKPTENHNIL